MLKKYFITILLVAVMCSTAFAEGPHNQSDIPKKEIKRAVTEIGQTGKEAGKTIGQKFKEIGKQTGKALKDLARTLRDAVQTQ